jgi:type IV secretory pathway VirB3-like protein
MSKHIYVMAFVVALIAIVVFKSILLAIPAALFFVAGYWLCKKEYAFISAVDKGIARTKELYNKLTTH